MSNGSDTTSNQAPYYEGLGFPVDRLNSESFENFVFGCLLSIQDVLGLKIIGKPSGSGDGGFDVQGEIVATGRLVCVQCKRQGQPLDMGQLVKELAKVAATSALEGSDIGEHRFICTGGVRNKVIRALRAVSREEIAEEVGSVLQNATAGELLSLRVKLEQRGKTPRAIAESYVLKLDRLIAWDLKEFDAALSPRWEAVLEVAQRYFQIATVVRDNPRAKFNRLAYIAEYRDFNTAIEPRFVAADLPTGISITTAANFNTSQNTELRSFDDIDSFLQLDVGDLALIVGQGGSGKSTSLALIRARALQISPEYFLPVLISLATYTPGSLEVLINQELNTDYGTWRLLPDKVLLLCDGLNECSHLNTTTFLGELSLLLRRKRIACILSSREPNRLSNIILPQPPLGCVAVQNITPIVVRKIAESELDQHSVGIFTRNYIQLADNAGSSLLWTPFAVKVALRVWSVKSEVPNTLGEMIEVLLQSRSIRNADIPQPEIHSTVLLQLASALAFQCMFVNKRIEFPLSEAGRWIRESKKHCSDALGIEELRDREIVELLVSHELLCISERGYIGFGHQLLAGSLAATLLAETWLNHLDSLRESVTDDAWVFAARLVSTKHMQNYLRTVLNVDLILGARVARELPSDLQDIAAEMLSRSIAPEVSEIIRLQGLYALARLGTPRAVAQLRDATNEADRQISYSAFRALASTGDVIYLRGLLPEIDRLKSLPMKFSGGKSDIWKMAPLSVRINLARERLSRCGAGEPVGESLLLLAHEKDPSDISVIKLHLQAAPDLIAFQIGLYALHSISPSQAKEIFDEVLFEHVEPHDKAKLIRVASGIGVDIDMHLAFECAMTEVTPEEPNDSSELYLQKLIADVLKNSELPHDLVPMIERDLPGATGARKARLWQVAHRCESPTISRYALSCIEQWTSDRGYACNYFSEILHSALTPKQVLLSLCERGLSEKENAYDWTTTRVFALVALLGFTTRTATSLSIMIKRLARIRIAVESNDHSGLSTEDLHAFNSIKSDHMLIHLGGLATTLIPAAAKARHLLSSDDLLLLLPFHTNGNDGLIELQREMICDVDDIHIDNVLASIRDKWSRLSALLIVSNRKPTDIRIKLIEQELRASYAHPSVLHILCRAIKNCWCEDVLEMILNTIASIPIWREQDAQFFWDFVRMVAERLHVEDLPAIESTALSARTPFAVKIINIWKEHASEEKIGLARLD